VGFVGKALQVRCTVVRVVKGAVVQAGDGDPALFVYDDLAVGSFAVQDEDPSGVDHDVIDISISAR
jgi:hypothetical protein